MASVTVQAVVLRFANYRDHDRMLTLFSPEHGRIDALSRGCRRPKSPLLPASELFVQGEFVLYQAHDRNTLTSCTLQDTFYPLRLDHYRLTCASYLLGLCHAAVQPEEPAPQLYGLLLSGLYHLAYGEEEKPLSIVSALLLLMADALGYRPRLKHCVHCRATLDVGQGAWLDIQAGGLVCPQCAGRTETRLTCEQVKWMCELLRNGMPPEMKTDASSLFETLRRYVESRLETPIKASRLLP